MNETAQQLTDIPDLTAEAWATWGTNPISAEGDKPHRMPGSIVLADLDRMMALDGANDHDGLGVLSAWVRAIADELDEAGTPTPLPDGTVAACCTWLAERLGWCARRGFEVELKADINRLHAALERICRVSHLPALECRTPGCTGVLTPVDGMLECQYGHRHDGLRKWRHHASMPEKVLAQLFDIPLGTLRSWRSRGRLARDEARSSRAESYLWPWDVLRMKYPELVEWVEEKEAA